MEADTMQRREFILLLGGAATWPLAEQPGRMHRIGVLMVEQRAQIRRVGVLLPGAPADSGHFASAFVQGLKIAGYVDGENVALEYRWAEGRTERLPQLAAELVQSGVAVIAVGGPQASLAAKSVTSTVPIVAVMGDTDVMLKRTALPLRIFVHRRQIIASALETKGVASWRRHLLTRLPREFRFNHNCQVGSRKFGTVDFRH
jgi:hypothetical protein